MSHPRSLWSGKAIYFNLSVGGIEHYVPSTFAVQLPVLPGENKSFKSKPIILWTLTFFLGLNLGELKPPYNTHCAIIFDLKQVLISIILFEFIEF